MKVCVNTEACVGQGMCVLYAPQVFRLNDEDGRALVASPDVPAGLEDAVRQAANACPEQAIIITD